MANGESGSETERVLTEFGRERVQEIVTRRAEKINAQTSVWRYYAEIAFDAITLIAIIITGLQLTLVVFAPVLGEPVMPHVVRAAMAFIITLVSVWGSDVVANPVGGRNV